MKISLTGISALKNELDKFVEKLVDEVSEDVYKQARKETPVRTGYTKKQWREKTAKTEFNVENKVPWIERLDAGSSRKAPNGISMPTITKIKGKYK